MAKTIAPLFSFGASGQLAKSLVYFPWKGIEAVRSYSVPANPNSAGQQTQRALMGEAVDLWHSLGLDADDVAAWNRYAATLPRPMSGFNAFVRDYVNLRVGGVSQANSCMGFDGSVVDSGAGQVDMSIEEDGSATAVDFLWGYSPTALINTQAGGEAVNVWTALNVAVNSGVIVYMRARLSFAGPTIGGYSGLYRFGPTS